MGGILHQKEKRKNLPPASQASREVANLTERKNLHTPVYGVKEFVCLSVCLSVANFVPDYLRTGRTEWAKKMSVTNFDPNYLGTGKKEWAVI